MSKSAALSRAQSLREALLDHGVRKVSIELHQGRPGTPNGRWYDTRFIGILSHHIVSSRSMGLTPGLALVKRGRSDLPGPLANGYGGFDETYRILCMGWANHPGKGGPWTIPGGTIPRDNGRPYLWGTEYEGGIREADWTDEFREFMGRSNAGIADWLNVDERSHGEHLTWAPDRKIDRLNYTTSSGRAELARWADVGRDWFDMASKDDLKKAVAEVLRDPQHGIKTRTGEKWSLRYTIDWLAWKLTEAHADVNGLPDSVWRHRLPWRGWESVSPELAGEYDDGLSGEAYAVHAYGRSKQTARLAQEIRQLVRVQIDAYEGKDTEEILERVDQRAAEQAKRDAQLEVKLSVLSEKADGLMAVLGDFESGQMDAEQVVQRMVEIKAAMYADAAAGKDDA